MWWFRDLKYKLRWFLQRLTRGYSDDEVWSFRYAHARWCLKRLRAFRAKMKTHPAELTPEQWWDYISTMIEAFEIIERDDTDEIDREFGGVRRGLQLFADWYLHLWD